MAKYKVLKPFTNLDTNETYSVDQEVELTVKRADEIISKLKAHDGEFLERSEVEDKKEAEEKDVKKSKEK